MSAQTTLFLKQDQYICRVHTQKDLLCLISLRSEMIWQDHQLVILLPSHFDLDWACMMRSFFENRLLEQALLTQEHPKFKPLFLYELTFPLSNNHQILYETDLDACFPEIFALEKPAITELFQKKLGYRQGKLYIVPSKCKKSIFDFNLCFLRSVSIQQQLLKQWILTH